MSELSLKTTEEEKAEVPAVAEQVGGYLNLIEKAVEDPNCDPDKLHRLLDFQERVMDKQAEINFNQAMTEMMLEMPVINKDGAVEYQNKTTNAKEVAFRYASFENIMKAVKPILQKYGFTMRFNTKEREDGGAIITGILSHKDGHKESTEFSAALDSSGGKNNIQAMGSTFSYGKRYCVTALLNIITEGEDNDGNIQGQPIDDAQFTEIQRLIDESKADTAAFCKHMRVSSLKEIRQDQYAKATNALKAKIEKQKKQQGGSNDTL